MSSGLLVQKKLQMCLVLELEKMEKRKRSGQWRENKGIDREYKTKQEAKIEDWRLSENAHDGLILSKLP